MAAPFPGYRDGRFAASGTAGGRALQEKPIGAMIPSDPTEPSWKSMPESGPSVLSDMQRRRRGPADGSVGP
jgi:hypothetical protein